MQAVDPLSEQVLAREAGAQALATGIHFVSASEEINEEQSPSLSVEIHTKGADL